MAARRIHEIIPVGMLACNCSILGDAETREAIVIDPGDEVARIQEILDRHQLRVCLIVSTHTHIDHVGGLARLHETSGAPVMFHHDDLQMYQHLDAQAKWLGVRPPPVTEVTNFVKEGDALECGAWKLLVMHTPGHSQGSISLYAPAEKDVLPRHSDAKRAGVVIDALEIDAESGIAPVLFAGDTLFAGSIGRTDLWGGSLDDIMRSLRGKLMALPDDTVVIPGHGPPTTIGEERETNSFLQ
jgi:glyoxylase-like metal-dependent hydrolase (beta-lactamase superfamily II)